jgi:uncharacterized pyridoxamine 5'-phosphate oxidase family protein
MNTKNLLTTFSEDDIKSFLPEMKIGLLATVNPQGKPHVSLISSIIASSPTQMAFGQFMEGLSKEYIKENPKTGFLIMSLDKQVWRGKATYTHALTSGEEFDFYNNIPMFRYNSYFGIHTVHYMDLLNHSGKSALPMGKVIWAAILSTIARTLAKKENKAEVINPWTRAFMNKLDNLKFLAYVDADGYPVLIPAIQTQTLDSSRLLFSTAVYGADLKQIPAGTSLAVFGMTLNMEDVLLRGEYKGIQTIAGLPCGIVEIDYVYNGMPPVPGQVYPPIPLKAVTKF